MNNFNLDDPLLEFVTKQGKSVWTIRHSLQNVHIWGSPGSGKSSGVGARLALKMLQAQYGALVMCVKPTEAEEWVRYCRLAGREKDLVLIEPGSKNYFNFLEYETAPKNGHFIADNIVDLLKTIISAGQAQSGVEDSSFWSNALDQLITNVVELCYLAYKKVTVELMFDIVSTIPRDKEALQIGLSKGINKPFFKAIELARENVNMAVYAWRSKLSEPELQSFKNEEDYQAQLMEAIPAARALAYVDQFFVDVYVNLADKTKSIIDFSFTGFLSHLLREPAYSLFCKHSSTVTPELCFAGKIIVLNIPVKTYHRAGRDAQNVFKYLFQRAVEKRMIDDSSRPVFLWSDENQFFLLESDQEFQTTCRSSRVSTVSLSQNLSNYYSMMAGRNSHDRVTSLLGTVGTHFFLSNSDVATNQYASSLIGEDYFEDIGRSIQKGKDFSQGRNMSFKLEKMVRPEMFARLKTGGRKNDFKVEAYMHLQGDLFASGLNHLKVSFNQLKD
ncbi:type IV secretory system conjugative DNA transfer family protein [Dyadobacter jiangsuensis]